MHVPEQLLWPNLQISYESSGIRLAKSVGFSACQQNRKAIPLVSNFN